MNKLILGLLIGAISMSAMASSEFHKYYIDNAIEYHKVWVEPPRKPYAAYQYSCEIGVLAKVEQCCQKIVFRGIDITATYDDWFHVGAALASLGENGRRLFHIVSAQNAQYKTAETDRKFDNCLRNVRSISIGTFFHICARYGIN